jgi:hypothetical protein
VPLLAALLYLIPVVALFVARARRDQPLWHVALGIPLAVAADMMLLLLVSRIVPLEISAFVTKGVAVAAAAGWLVLRRRRGDTFAFPRELGIRAVLAALSSATVLGLVSMTISRKYQVWDRFWHISLVSTIRTQKLPFANVYDPSRPLSYHYSGDALAAALQSLSGLTMHSSHALSLTHDLMFSLSGATLGLLLVSWGARGWSTAAAGSIAWVLAGPTALLRDDDKQWIGYNFVNYVTLSFRPHVSVAGLFILGFFGALTAPFFDRESKPRWPETAVPLLVFTAALSVTDESSCAVLCAALGVAWLVWSELLGPSRRHGVALLAALAASIVVANLLFAGLLAPGADRPSMSLVPWRSPGFAAPTLPFTSPNGAKYFFQDTAALLAFGAAFVIGALRARSRPAAAMAAFGTVTVAIAVFALGRLHIPPKPVEAHRFVTAAMLATPLVALFWLLRERERSGLASPFVATLLGVSLVLPAASTFAWFRSPGKTTFQNQASFAPGEDFFLTDCAKELGVDYGLAPRPAYISKSVFFVYAGCRPSFLAGRSGGHKIKTSAPLHGFDALADLGKSVLAPGAAVDAVCPAGGGNDPICDAAIRHGECEKIGKTRGGFEIVRCTLTSEDQRALLASRPRKGKPGGAADQKPQADEDAPDPDQDQQP